MMTVQTVTVLAHREVMFTVQEKQQLIIIIIIIMIIMIIMAEIAFILCGLATSNEGDAYGL